MRPSAANVAPGFDQGRFPEDALRPVAARCRDIHEFFVYAANLFGRRLAEAIGAPAA